MELGPRSRRLARRWQTIVAGTVACGVAVAAGTSGGARDVADVWTALVEAADRGGPVDLPRRGAGPPVKPRQAYLLAFHEAQDQADPEHVLAVADRLEATGELDLAAHVRRAAGTLLEEIASSLPAPPER